MFKKLSAFIFALTSFIVFPALAFANGGTFTASSYSYNVGSHHLSFHANSFSPDNSGWWRYGLCTIPVSGQNALTDDTHCAYTDGIQLTGNDLNVSVTLTHGLMSLNPGNVYIVMEDYDTGQEWVSQQITNMWDPYGSFTASSYSYDTNSHQLSFHANSFSPDNANWWRYGICNVSIGGQNNLTDDTHCAYTDGIQLSGNDLDVSVTLTHGLLSLNSGDVYIVMEDYDSGQEWLSQSISNLFGGSPTVQIVADPSSSAVTVGTPFTVDVKVTDSGAAFNAAQATVAVSSNLAISTLTTPGSNACNFSYTKTPSTTDPSFAGALLGSSSTGCTVYRLLLTPTTTGTGTVTFTNAFIKSSADSSEILNGVQNGSFTINAASPTPTPPGTTLVTVDDSVQGSGQSQWNYVGNGWSHCTDSTSCNSSSLYNNSTSWDNTTDDSATISFTGRQVMLYGLVDPNHGIGAVSIDGGSETNVDFYSATRTGNVLLWASPILTPGQHMFKVRVTGTKNSNSGGTYVAVDRADIVETTPSNLTVTNTVFDTYNSTFTLMGTKDSSITSVFVNGSSSNSTYPTSTTWQATEPVSLGNNNFTIYGTDASSNQTASITVSVNQHKLGDINGDGTVDIIDASLFAADWEKTSNLLNPLSDMDGNGTVDLKDFSILARQFGQ